MNQSDNARIFISYSHRGHGPEWKALLLQHLDVFEQHHLLDVWQDGRIRVSSSWDDEIKQAMSSSQLAVLLLTKEALESQYILETEFPFLRERQQREKLPIFPIICEECNWKAFDWLQATQAPNSSNPLSQLSDEGRDSMFRQLAINIAEELSRVILGKLPKPEKSPSSHHIFLDKFPLTCATGSYEEKLIGREQELALLDLAFAQPHTAIVSLIAWGGVGKTMLIRHWLQRLQRNNWIDARRVYAWSFYSQGTKEDRQASEDTFLASALEWFGVPYEPTVSSWEKGRLLADAIAREHTLLILDGIEPLQYPPGPMGGQLRGLGIQSLLKHLARKANETKHRGLCIITTREPLTDLVDFQRRPNAAWGSMLQVDLGNLNAEAGAALLHHAGARQAGASKIDADDTELMVTSREVDGHALTLSLLGRFLARAHNGDIRRRDRVKFEEADRREQGGTTFKMLAAFENWFAKSGEFGARQISILWILGLFDRPADPGCVSALRKPPVIAGLTDSLFQSRRGLLGIEKHNQPIVEEDWNTAVSFLADFGLVAVPTDVNNSQRLLDCHPLIREYFARKCLENSSNAVTRAHERLFKHLMAIAPSAPASIRDLSPLYQAVFHGCRARLCDSVWHAIFLERIRGGGTVHFSILRLGAFADDLAALSSFFKTPWAELHSQITKQDQAWILNETAFCLRSVCRFSESIEAFKNSFNSACDLGLFAEASTVAGNLGELYLLMGDIESAIVEERLSIELAEQNKAFPILYTYQTALADALQQAGQVSEAVVMFKKSAAGHETLFGNSQIIGQGNFRACELVLQEVEQVAWRAWMYPDYRTQLQPDQIARLEWLCSAAQHQARYSSDRSRIMELSILGPALNELIIGRSLLYKSIFLPQEIDRTNVRTEARQHLEVAVDTLRQAGQLDHMPRGLITRAWLRYLESDSAGARADLEEAWDIAERGPMRLHMADIHLHRARLFRDESELEKARLLIEQCGYWRRRQELEDCESAFKI